MKNIHERLDFALEYIKKVKKKSNKEVGKEAELSPQNINHMVKGRHSPSDKLLDLLENQYGVQRRWIMEGKGAAPGEAEPGAEEQAATAAPVEMELKDKYIMSLEKNSLSSELLVKTANAAIEAANATKDAVGELVKNYVSVQRYEADAASLRDFQESVVALLAELKRKTPQELRAGMGKT